MTFDNQKQDVMMNIIRNESDDEFEDKLDGLEEIKGQSEKTTKH